MIGEGSLDAEIMLVGEAPGEKEAISGRPFIGAAGKVLSSLLDSVGLTREEVYITSVLLDRLPGSRDPLPGEIKLYSQFLDRQIEIIQPKVVATLGRFSMAYLMSKFGLINELKTISNIHGQIFEAQTTYGKIKLIPLYHPAVALYQASMKTVLLMDFKKLAEFLKENQ